MLPDIIYLFNALAASLSHPFRPFAKIMPTQTFSFSPPWTPPPDPEKPNCPYQPDFKAEIRSHVAPEPFGHRLYGVAPRSKAASDVLEKVTQTTLVVENPPSEHATALPLTPVRGRLTVTDSIAIGNSRGAQLVACTVEWVGKDHGILPVTIRAVAKIFDALYYSFANKDFPTVPVDPTFDADADYSREVAAFEHMRDKSPSMLEGFAPGYHGSWTFDLPILHNKKVLARPVRLVLLEHLHWRSMKELYALNSPGLSEAPDAFYINEEWRLEVLKRLLEGIMKQRHIGVDQRDLATRNIYLVPLQGQTLIPGDSLPRVVLIDYNASIVWDRTQVEKHPGPKPRNPMEVYWKESLPELYGWLPNEWYQKPNLRQQWLVEQFGGKKAAYFEPVIHKLDFTECSQLYC